MRISTLTIVLVAVMFTHASIAQRSISGKITSDADKMGVPGVNILVKENPGIGTISDLDGNYMLTVPNDAKTLVFKFVGMETQEQEIGNRTIINVVMRDETKMLEGVIVTAIGIKSERKALGYAAQDLKADELNSTREPNIVNSLGSKVAGVAVTSSSGTPGAASKITIRGSQSMTGQNGPLFVIDGVPMDNSFEGSSSSDRSNRAIDLNNDDIESVTVLKGPAATALYGINAAGGAIIITTKKGAGKGNKPLRVEVSSQFSIDKVNKLPEKQKKYTLGTGGSITDPQHDGGTALSWGALIDTCRFDGISNPYDPNGYIRGMSSLPSDARLVAPYDNAENFFQNAMNFNNYLSVSGTGKKGNYYFSAGRLNQTGVIPLSDFSRTSLKLSGDYKLLEKLSVTASATYTNSGGSRNQRGSNASGVLFGLMRANEMFDLSNGVSDPVNDKKAYMLNDTLQRTFYGDIDNPYWSINKNKVRDKVNRLISFAQVDFKPFSGVNITYRAGIDTYTEHVKDYLSDYSKDNYNVGLIYFDTTFFRSFNSDLILSFDKDLSEDLNLQVITGHNFYSRRREFDSRGGEDFIAPGIYDLSNVNTLFEPSHSLTRYKTVGIYYDVKLSFKKFLYLSTTGRNDWSSTLPKNRNNFFYPSVNAGFIFTEVLGLTDSKYLSFGKIRVNYAEVGKDAPFGSLTTPWSSANEVRGNKNYTLTNQIGNSKITPEKTRSYEAGADLRFFQNRINVDFSYYKMFSIDQIVPVTIAPTTGGTELTVNVGKLNNEGVELQLGVTPLKTNDFAWDAQFNFSKNKSEIIKLYKNLEMLPTGYTYGVSSTENVFIVGQPYGVIYGSRWKRDSLNRIVIDSLSGFPLVDAERGIVGDPNPDWQLSIRNTFSYKGFSLSFLVDIRHGGDMYNGTAGVMKSLGVHKETLNRNEDVVFHGVYADGRPNDKAVKWADYYQRYGRTMISEGNIEDGSWVRLKELSVNYSLPKTLLESIYLERVDIGFSGRNLFLITDYSGIDPDTNLSGASNSYGRDYFNNPGTKSFMFNVKLVF